MDLSRKLSLRGRSVRVHDAPPGLELGLPREDGSDEARLFFVPDLKALRAREEAITSAARADRLVWVAYPKGGQQGSDLNRDRLAAELARGRIRPVTQIAIDGTWSALRSRPAPEAAPSEP